jgi:UDP-2,3-diacylglucosamine hydrolase
VNCDAANTLLRQHHYPRLIHGHIHLPSRHLHHLDDHSCERWVLGDWDHRANALRCDSDGISWENIPD